MSETNNQRVTILHTNDIHGRYRPFAVMPGSATSQTGDSGQVWDQFEREGLVGGFASLATAVQRIREERGVDNVVLVDGGDTFSDDLLGNLTKGEVVIRLMNELGYQFMALGNHDYDYGAERTRELQQLARFPMRAANVLEDESDQPFLGDPTLVTEAAGLRIGLLALGYHNTPQTGNRKNVEGLTFGDGLGAVRRYLPALRERSDVAIVLSHLGTSVDRLLAREVPEIDLIIGAHSHDRIGVEWVGRVPIVQAVSDAAVLGDTVLTIDRGRVVDVQSHARTLWVDEYPPNGRIARQVEKLRAPYREQLEEVIATAAAPIDRNYRSESPFDKLVGEILCREYDAEIAFLPGIGYGVTLLPGPITREALYTLLPHPATVVTLTLSGGQVREVLEQSATNQKAEDPRKVVGGIVQTAGIRWTIDYRAPEGHRVREIQIGGEPLDDDRAYRSATNSGMYAGLHCYRSFAEGRDVRQHDQTLAEVVEAAMREMGVVRPPETGDLLLASETA